MATATTPQPELRVEYANASAATPSEPFVLTSSLPPVPPPSSTAPPTEYLRAVRGGVTALQEQINAELTSRMEEDKRREAEAALAAGDGAAAGGGKKSNKRKKGKVEIDEEAEEQNYGEEVVEED